MDWIGLDWARKQWQHPPTENEVFLYFAFPGVVGICQVLPYSPLSCREHREMLPWRKAERNRSQGRLFRETNRLQIETKSKLELRYGYFKSPMGMGEMFVIGFDMVGRWSFFLATFFGQFCQESNIC